MATVDDVRGHEKVRTFGHEKSAPVATDTGDQGRIEVRSHRRQSDSRQVWFEPSESAPVIVTGEPQQVGTAVIEAMHNALTISS